MLQTEVTKTKVIKLSQTCQECNSARTREEDAVSFNVRIYWITSNSQDLVVSRITSCPKIPSTLVAWPRQMQVLLFQYQLLILTTLSHITQVIVSITIYMCVCYTYRHIYPYMLHTHNIYRLHICVKYTYMLNIWTAYMGYIYNITYVHTYLCVHMCIYVCV